MLPSVVVRPLPLDPVSVLMCLGLTYTPLLATAVRDRLSPLLAAYSLHSGSRTCATRVLHPADEVDA